MGRYNKEPIVLQLHASNDVSDGVSAGISDDVHDGVHVHDDLKWPRDVVTEA